MEWSLLQDALKDLVAATSGLDAYNAIWDGEPETMRGYPMALLQLTKHGRDTATDELRYEDQADGSSVPVVVGHRTLTMQITVRSRDHRGEHKAFTVCERIRNRLELPAVQERLDELGVVLRDVTPTTDRSVVSQQREESLAEISLTFGYVVEERDDENPVQPIEHIEVSGSVAEVADGGDEAVIEIPERTIP